MRTRREEWARRVRRWRRSGLTARDFADSIGVNRNTLTYWAWRLEGGRSGGDDGQCRQELPSTTEAFVELITEGIADGRFELELAGNRRLRIPPGFEPGALERLLAVLEARR